MERSGISRRGALTGAASLGLALPVLAACAGDDDPEQATDPSAPSDPVTPESDPTAEPSDDAAPPGLLSAAEVPVGGGLIVAREKLVVTQPTKGDFRGFTAVCTHQGCLVETVTTTIDCPCHGSRFSIEDGSVVGGPAPSALARMELAVQGDSIDLAQQ